MADNEQAGVVVVVGGGTMGAGIAQIALQAGVTVSVSEADAGAVDAARSRIADGLRLAHKRAEDRDAAVSADMGRLTVATDVSDVTPDLVIEALPENAAMKRRVLGPLGARWPDAVIATNTSSLSIDGLADGFPGPERFLGMHFFNPVPRSALVELVVGAATAPATTEMARSWVSRLGKESIAVRDTPGFATSRLGVVIGLEAIRMVAEGVASAADIDRGMVLGYRFPMGPLELTDLVGLDVRLAIAEHLAAELDPRFEPPALLRDKVAAGELGKKTGRGFYDWTQGSGLVPVEP
ncbi:MAG: 3-hydroxyacyl-CoA dehydrogenase family protein [Actinomycetota bacterium]|nr:3-hydroxyacyl-CoA dehydrogenase family protein [Actinomycetota bacterium]